MTAPKKPGAKKPATRKPATRKPAAKKEAPAESPKLDPKEEARKAATKPPGEIPPKPSETKPAVPGYVTENILDTTMRTALIDDFNKSFNAEFDHRLKEPKVLKNMQRRLLQQVYNK